MKKIIIVLLSVLLLGDFASASYFKGQLGYNLSGEAGSGGVDSDFESEFLSPFSLAFGIERDPRVSIEFELLSYSNDFDEDPSLSGGFIGLGMNLIYNFATNENSKIEPYIGAGLLMGNYEISSIFASVDEFGIAMQVMGGADLIVNNAFSIGGELRYNQTLVEPEFGSIDVSFSYISFGIVGKFRLHNLSR